MRQVPAPGEYRWQRLARGADWLGFDIGDSLVYDAVLGEFPTIEHGAIQGAAIRWFWLPFELCGRRRFHTLIFPDRDGMPLKTDMPLVLTGSLPRHPNSEETRLIRLWLDEYERVDHDNTPQESGTPVVEGTTRPGRLP